MKLKKITAIFSLFILNIIFSQTKEPELTVNLLENDKIADVNVNQDKFIKSIGKVIDYCKANFANLPTSQKIGIMVIAHKEGKPTFKCYSNPKISNELQLKILSDLNTIDIENTKLVDFPIFISINSKNDGKITDFDDFINPVDQRIEDYKNANLENKLKLNKEFAINIVLPVLAAYCIIVDDKFEGVKSYGKLLTSTNFNEPQNIENLIYKNENYWRATMEMESGNQLIPITNIFALISQGEIDYAFENIEIVNMFSNPKTISSEYLEELIYRLDLFRKELHKEIAKGIAKHDEGKYAEAIEIYNQILKIYPNSSWALYEKYYSQNAKNLIENKLDVNDRTDWDIAKVEIYKHNPLYDMDVRASNGKEAYLLYRRREMLNLFKEKDNQLNDVFEYAAIATDLGIYDFAAQLFWFSTSFDKKNQQNAINHYLYCLNKLGINSLQSVFKGDFDEIFINIDTERETKMKQSKIYNSMKN